MTLNLDKLSAPERDRLLRAMAELARRRAEALGMYEPMDAQEAFHASKLKERLFIGGNRCLAPWQKVYDPVAGQERDVGDIDGPFHVLAMNPLTGAIGVAEAKRPFIKSVGTVFRYVLDSGGEFFATQEHRILTNLGWKPCGGDSASSPFLLPSTSELCPSVRGEDGRRYSRTPEDSQGCCWIGRHPCGGPPLLAGVFCQEFAPQQGGAHGHIPQSWRRGDLADGSGYSLFCQRCGHLSTLDAHFQILDPSGASCIRCGPVPFAPLLLSGQADGQSLGMFGLLRTTSACRQSASPRHQPSACRRRERGEFGTLSPDGTQAALQSCPCSCQEVGAEQLHLCRSSRIVSIEKAGEAEIYDFHVPYYNNYLLQSIVHHNSGKTTVGAVEAARALTGRDPHGKFPLEDGRGIVIGKDLKHLGRVIHRKLFRAGAFRMIRDVETGEWRTYRPWDLNDMARFAQSKPAPPLIPNRFIKSISWEKKAENIPSVVTFKNGWELAFYSSLGKPQRGVDVDFVWLDEEIVESEWYDEMLARIIDRRGRIWWTATPQAATEQLYALHERAEEARGLPDRTIEEFTIHLDENKYLREEDRKSFAASLDEEARIVRVEGGWAIQGYRVFPEWNAKLHMVPVFPVPETWTRYLWVDPGTQFCAVLSVVVAPPDDERWGWRLVFEDELYLRRCTAEIFGKAVGQRFESLSIQALFIDPRSARVQEMGAGKTIHQQYAEALAANKVFCAETGSNFAYGSSDVQGRIGAFKSLLSIKDNRTAPRLAVMERCQNLAKELGGYHYRVLGNGTITDEPLARKDHLIWCAGACAQYDPKWKQPRLRPGTDHALAAFRRKRDRKKLRDGPGREIVSLGPPEARLEER